MTCQGSKEKHLPFAFIIIDSFAVDKQKFSLEVKNSNRASFGALILVSSSNIQQPVMIGHILKNSKSSNLSKMRFPITTAFLLS